MEKVGVGWVCFSGLGSGLGLVTIGLGSMKFGSIQTRVKFFSPYLGWVHKKIVRLGLGWPKGPRDGFWPNPSLGKSPLHCLFQVYFEMSSLKMKYLGRRYFL